MFKKVLAIVLSAVTVFAVGAIVYAKNADNAVKNVDLESIYGVVKTDRWKQLSRTERADACQVDKETLKNMSTDDLIRVVISYPFFADIYAFDNIETGYDFVLAECNALQELVTRKDRIGCLLRAYEELSKESTKENGSSNAKIELIFIEQLLKQKDFKDVL